MNFTTPEFAAFFAVVFGLYYVPSFRTLQVWILILGSLVFYAWSQPALLGLLIVSYLITGTTSFLVLRSPLARPAAPAAVGVILNLAVLAFFKYKFLFLSSQAGAGHLHETGLVATLLVLPLPIGISFYTFHGISLLVDALRNEEPFFRTYSKGLGRHFLDTALYLVFFPQLIAGPIAKAKNFCPQIRGKAFRAIPWESALRCLVTGIFLKIVVADNLAQQTFWISPPYFEALSSLALTTLLVGYSCQIFADFAGYSLIAIGLASLLGYQLPQNFNFPYLSQSISEFWRRWHMSLSSWLRDYLYVPLGGSRRGGLRTYLNLFIVMFLGGLWHGAAWSFAVWGTWHGIGLALERPFLNSPLYMSNSKLVALTRTAIVFAFVSMGWLLFKLTNIADAAGYARAIYANRSLSTNWWMIVLTVVYGLPVAAYHAFQLLRADRREALRPYCYAAMIFLIIFNPGPTQPFVYFQF